MNQRPTYMPQAQAALAEHLAAMADARREAGRREVAGIGKRGSFERRIIFEKTFTDRHGSLTYRYHATKGWRVRSS